MTATPVLRSPIPYFGGKSRLAPWIVSLFPAHRVYVEPFFGGGSVLFAKRPSSIEIVNDLDGAVVAFWRALRDDPEGLERLCLLSPHSRTEFREAVLDPSLADLELARRFFVKANQSFTKSVGKNGWSITTARTQSTAWDMKTRCGRFADVAGRLSGVTLECCDGIDLALRSAHVADAVVYLDPPYAPVSRNGGHERRNDYAKELTTQDHVRLLAGIQDAAAAVFISGYRCDLYDEMLARWTRFDRSVTVTAANSTRDGRRSAIESVWCNRPPVQAQGSLW